MILEEIDPSGDREPRIITRASVRPGNGDSGERVSLVAPKDDRLGRRSERRFRITVPPLPDERMIDLAGSLSLEVDAGTDAVEVAVTATNVGPAHALPTGEPLRHMLLVVEATCAGEALSATGGDVIPDFGGLVAEKGAGEDWSQWDSAAVGDRVRVLGWDGDWYDYTGHGPFGDGSFDVRLGTVT